MTAGEQHLIDEELKRFFQGPVSAILGSTDQMNVPDATRVAGFMPLDGERVRVLISTEARTARANTVVGAKVALLVTDITNYRSIQLKGRVVTGPQERTAGDIALMHRHIDAFCRAAPQIGIDAVLAAQAIFPVDVVALVLEFDDMFDQTPGPGAGRRIEVSR